MSCLRHARCRAQDGRSRTGKGSFSASQAGQGLREEQERLITTSPGILVDEVAEAARRQMFGDKYFDENTMPTHVQYRIRPSQQRDRPCARQYYRYYILMMKGASKMPSSFYMATAKTMRERHPSLRD